MPNSIKGLSHVKKCSRTDSFKGCGHGIANLESLLSCEVFSAESEHGEEELLFRDSMVGNILETLYDFRHNWKATARTLGGS